MFEWGEVKSAANRTKHGLAFEAAYRFDWDDPVIINRDRLEDGEKRYAAIGMLDRKLHTVIFTFRGKKSGLLAFVVLTERKKKLMKKPRKKADDAPLTAKELKTARRLRDDPVMARAIKRARGRPVGRTKETIHLSLDADIVAFLRRSGKGWQTRVNEVLKAFVGLAG